MLLVKLVAGRAASGWARTLLGLLATYAAVLIGGLVLCSPVSAFDAWKDSIDVHRRITRIAIGCDTSPLPATLCMQSQPLDELAGVKRNVLAGGNYLGGVDLNDAIMTSILSGPPHCDNADFISQDPYAHSRADATKELRKCIGFAREHFNKAVRAASRLVDANGRPAAPAFVSGCFGHGIVPSLATAWWLGDARCMVFGELGQALHTVQDFYSHSNYADHADPHRPISSINPPGMGMTRPAPFFDLSGSDWPAIPRNLTTGCDYVTSHSPCARSVCIVKWHKVWKIKVPSFDCGFRFRVRHGGIPVLVSSKTDKGLNKDSGRWVNGTTPGRGETYRGKIDVTIGGQVHNNFADAVNVAIADTRLQWRRFAAALVRTYGAVRAAEMMCMLTQANPNNYCQPQIAGPTTVLGPSDNTPPSVSLTVTYIGGQPDGQDRNVLVDHDMTLYASAFSIAVTATGADPEGLKRLDLHLARHVTCRKLDGTFGQQVYDIPQLRPTVVQDRHAGQVATTELHITWPLTFTSVDRPVCPEGMYSAVDAGDDVYTVSAIASNFYGGSVSSPTVQMHSGRMYS